MVKYRRSHDSPMCASAKVLDCEPKRGVSYILLVAVSISALYSFFFDIYDQTVISVLIAALLAFTLWDRGRTVMVPDAFKMALVFLTYITLMGAVFNLHPVFTWVSNLIIGIILGAVGFILVYGLLGRMPGSGGGKAAAMAVLATTFALGVATLWELSEFALNTYLDIGSASSLQNSMTDLAGVLLGALLMALAHYQRRRTGGIFNRMVACFIRTNPKLIAVSEKDDQEALRSLIAGGEGERLEFKSTLRRNVHTGEKDKRMEKAVLKSLVAFLNSSGGTLLIGVDDEGGVPGVDVDSFESRDKMGLHFTNIISSQIGNSFLPFISFRLVPIEDVLVLRTDCRPSTEPVFLRDGNEEFFYIRSGPSSVEIKGRELIGFIDRRFRD